MTINQGNLKVTHNVAGQWQGHKGTFPVSSGKWYYEVQIAAQPTDVTQNTAGDYTFTGNNLDTDTSSTTWENYKDNTPAENQQKYDDDYYVTAMGQRYGLEPSHAQSNGSFFIDDNTGKIHFSSNIENKTVILKYISDSLGTDAEMQVHKFAEEAMYKWIAYGILSTRVGIPDNIIMRLRRDKIAETRKAKLRLSNIKIEEITQILRGKSKHIKH